MLDSMKTLVSLPLRHLQRFIHVESISGIVLFLAAVMALLLDNSAWSEYYQAVFKTPFSNGHSLSFWVNDGLMPWFFLLVGLEIKREILVGELSRRQQRILPGIAALGGIIVPAIIYSLINWHSPVALKGWAIPSATDIAFALGILALLGQRVPLSLKVFLMALAILDDLAAILIIAVFYTQQIDSVYLGLAALMTLGLIRLNYKAVTQLSPYLLLGCFLWYCLLNAGIHPTIAGVITAFSVPLHTAHHSPLRRLEHYLHPWVAYAILPLFALANAGISFADVKLQHLFDGVAMGIVLGLFLGKQIGVFGACALAVKMGWAKLPEGATWYSLYGVAITCGVGFTMSLFIGELAFNSLATLYELELRLGVITGSTLSGLLGYYILYVAGRAKVNNMKGD